MLRRVLLAAAGRDEVRRAVQAVPYSRGVVSRFVAGTTAAQALTCAAELTGSGLLVTLDHLGEDTVEPAQAAAVVDAYCALLDQLGRAGLGTRAEVSVKLSAVGQALDEDLALAGAARICRAADEAGTTVTLDMEDHTTVDSTLRILAELRARHPGTGAVVQAYLRRSVELCAELSGPGSRVRLCKGAYRAPDSVAHQSRTEIDRSYVRCMKVLLAGQGYPMLATHDPRLIDIAGSLAVLHDRAPASFEYQLLYGVRPAEQRRLTEQGAQVRVYLPYGEQWYGYLMRRLAERPAYMGFFLRALLGRS